MQAIVRLLLLAAAASLLWLNRGMALAAVLFLCFSLGWLVLAAWLAKGLQKAAGRAGAVALVAVGLVLTACALLLPKTGMPPLTFSLTASLLLVCAVCLAAGLFVWQGIKNAKGKAASDQSDPVFLLTLLEDDIFTAPLPRPQAAALKQAVAGLKDTLRQNPESGELLRKSILAAREMLLAGKAQEALQTLTAPLANEAKE